MNNKAKKSMLSSAKTQTKTAQTTPKVRFGNMTLKLN